jgi:hypothetical protein
MIGHHWKFISQNVRFPAPSLASAVSNIRVARRK